MKTRVLTFLLMAASAVFAETVSFTPDDTTIFPNPERGFITMLERQVSPEKPYAVKGRETYLAKHAENDHGSLILVIYYLDNYKSVSLIPDEILDAFDADMQVLRNYGMKCILRFAYTNSNADDTGHDAPLSVVQSHLAQYKSHWKANADVIFVFQAGIVGAWGEWYYSDNFGNKYSHINDARRALLDTLLATVPADRCIQLRTPLFKTEYIGSTAPLTDGEAYAGTPKARLGHHNDAFLYHASNMGTYTDTAAQKPYIAQETLYVPIGGESDITDDEQAAVEAAHDVVVAEMSRLHWTFIQSGYSTTVTDMWRSNGTFDELNRNMGYRFQLLSATLPDVAQAGQKIDVSLRIQNVGYAPLYNLRTAYLVLRNDDDSYALPLPTDPRTWLPNGAVSTISGQITLPAAMLNGTYQACLWLPDAYSSLANDPRYAVRLANTGVWEETTGMNNLGISVTVTHGQDEVDNTVALPATLNKNNVDAYSDDMTWYNTDYFDFGPTDAPNLERWAQWQVELRYPGSYLVSEVSYCTNGHTFSLQLTDGNEVVAAYTTADRYWGTGDQDYTQKEKWNLASVAEGKYTLHVRNATQWGQPKLRSLTLAYDGDLPSNLQTLKPSNSQPSARKFLRDGLLFIMRGDNCYTLMGTAVR